MQRCRELSAAQLGIWLGHQHASSPNLFNCAERVTLDGPLSVPRFEAALRETVEAADTLHHAYVEVDGQPRAMRLDEPAFRYAFIDVSNDEAPEARIEHHVRELLERPLCIERGELYAHRLFRVSPARHVWLHLAHHIALDGFGFQLIARCVARLYSNPMASPKFGPFAAVLEADDAYQRSERQQRDARYWQRGPGAPLRALRLSPYERRGGAPEHPAAAKPVRAERNIAGADFARLVNSARSRGWGWPELLLALVAGFGHAATRRRRFALGVPVMLRLQTPALSVPCMAMNIVRLPVCVTPGTTLEQLVSDVAERLRHQSPHQHFRYEALANQSFGPVVNILPFAAPQRFGDVQASACNLAAGPVMDLSLTFTFTKQCLRLTLDGHPQLFTLERLTALHSHLWSFAERCLSAPKAPISASGREVAGLSGSKSIGVSSRADDSAASVDVVRRLRRVAARHPDAIALIEGERQYSYRELDAAARRGAEQLLGSGAQPCSLIAIELGRSATAICALLSALYAGCGYLALDPRAPPERRARMLARAAPALLIAHAGSAPAALDQAMPRLDAAVLEGYLQRSTGASAALSSRHEEAEPAACRQAGLGAVAPCSAQAVEPTDTAYVVFTSGSTGEPKGVVISHGALAHYLTAIQHHYRFAPGDRILQFSPLTFDASVEEVFATLCSGATLVLRDDAMLESMPAFCAACERWQITVLALPTAFWHELAWATGRPDVSIPQRVHSVIIGGEAAHPRRVLQWCAAAPHTRLLNTYGPSEATIVATVAELRCGSLDEAELSAGVPIGAPLEGINALVLDDAGEAVKLPATDGELHLAGACLADGYLGRDDLTAERFVYLPKHGVRAYRTGDRVRRDAAGCLVYLGRVDEEIKLSGHRIAPAEVEGALNRHPLVRASVVLGHREGPQLFLVAHLECDTLVTPSELREFLAAHLPAAMIPSVYQRHARLPRNASGKLDRTALTASALTASALTASAVEEQPAELERLVIETWRAVLGVSAFGLDDDFFSLGGNSLQLIQVANRLSRQSRSVSVATLFRHPTPRRLAAALARLASDAAESSAEPRSASTASHTAGLDAPSGARARDFRAVEALDASAFKGASANARMDHVLLTGASGFVGIHLLEWLCQHTELPLTCLVRADSAAAGRAKLRKLALRYRLELPGLDERVVVIAQDLSLGLSREVTRALEPGDAVLHCAAEVSLTRDFDSLHSPNVQATRQLLELSARAGARFHHISTLAVTPHADPKAPVLERFFPAHEGLRDGYQQSKWHAEQLCAQASALGLPVTVYRLGRITGSSSNPSVNPRDFVWRIARASVRAKTWPDLDLAEPWLPVDRTASVIGQVLLAQGAEQSLAAAPARVLHLAHLQPVHLIRLYSALVSEGYPLERAPFGRWLEAVRHAADDEDLATLAFFDLVQDGSGSAPKSAARFDCSRLLEHLTETAPSEISDTLIRRYCKSAASAGVLPPAPGGRPTVAVFKHPT